MATWPTSLPQLPLLDGFSEEVADDSVIRSDVSAGTAKTRPRYTSVREIVTEDYLLTVSQYRTFKQFFKQDLKFGAERFDKYDPVDQEDRQYRIIGEPGYSQEGLYVRISLELEKFPA